MTKEELAELQYKKTILAVAEAHQQAEDLESVSRYFIPTEEKVNCFLLSLSSFRQRPDDKYEEEQQKGVPDEGKRWEQQHLSSALYTFGARDKMEQVRLFLCESLLVSAFSNHIVC